MLSAVPAVAQIDGPLSVDPPISAEAPSSSNESAPPAHEPGISSVAVTPNDLPDAPSAAQSHQEDVVSVVERSLHNSGKEQAPCTFIRAFGAIYFDPSKVDQPRPRCSELVYPYERFLSTNIAIPLNWKQKGYLAAHYTTDPASLGTIVGISAISIAANSHTAYGPGLKGFGELAGVSLLQNATAQFFGTFAVPALTHQDPRYYRMPNKPLGKRILYSITRSYVSRSDDGKTIPNYGVFATYPILAEFSNLYVPGIQSDGASTAERIVIGLALDPVNNLVNEFLPDVAKRVHVRIIFVQQIFNNLAVSGSGPM
ncbi:hypothetical protein [Edaphobacter modestus]|uniref:hypothetical protein n=1 Tax=Edaphobacter modestus TaxID=388466 RepID=UPI00102B01F1|nr:hypothetical protein [Edaphobacter modestus]